MNSPGVGDAPHEAQATRMRGRGLAFVTPITSGDRVAVVGDHPAVAATAALLGAHAATCTSLAALPDASVDHVIVPDAGGGLASWAPAVARVLRPGGYLYIGAIRRGAARRSGTTPGAGRRILTQAGFGAVTVFGLRDLAQARHLVPLDSTESVRWYVRSAFPVATTGQALTAAMARIAPARWAGRLCLPALGFRARRRP